jgi:hypothetical protein
MSKLKVDTIANSADSASTPIADVINGSARAWVNFNGTGTVAIRAAYNVSSITDNGTGDYTVNFTTALADANYAFSVGHTQNASGSFINTVIESSTTPRSTTQFRVACLLITSGTSVSAFDTAGINIAIFR